MALLYYLREQTKQIKQTRSIKEEGSQKQNNQNRNIKTCAQCVGLAMMAKWCVNVMRHQGAICVDGGLARNTKYYNN